MMHSSFIAVCLYVRTYAFVCMLYYVCVYVCMCMYVHVRMYVCAYAVWRCCVHRCCMYACDALSVMFSGPYPNHFLPSGQYEQTAHATTARGSLLSVCCRIFWGGRGGGGMKVKVKALIFLLFALRARVLCCALL